MNQTFKFAVLTCAAIFMAAPVSAQSNKTYVPQTTFHHKIEIPRNRDAFLNTFNNDETYVPSSNNKGNRHERRQTARERRIAQRGQQNRSMNEESRTVNENGTAQNARQGRRERQAQNARERSLRNAAQRAVGTSSATGGLND